MGGGADPPHSQNIDEDLSSFATVDRLVFELLHRRGGRLGAICKIWSSIRTHKLLAATCFFLPLRGSGGFGAFRVSDLGLWDEGLRYDLS